MAYEITQVNIPGVLSAYQAGRQSRLQEMAMAREARQQEAEDERRIKREGIYTRLFAPQAKGGDPASGGTAPAPQSTGVAPSAPTSLVDPTQLPPRTDGLTLNPDALRELYAVAPEEALKLQGMVYNLDKDRVAQMRDNAGVVASVAYGLKKVPPQERAARLQQWAPALAQAGIPTDALGSVDLSDNALDGYIVRSRAIADLVKADEPDWKVIPYGGGILNVRDPNAVSAFGERAPLSAPQPGAVEGGYRFNGGDPGDPANWSPAGGPTQPASGGFPGN